MLLTCVLYLTGIGIVSFVAGRLLPKTWFLYDRFPFRPLAAERGGKLYLRLGVRRWKDTMPDMSRVFPGIMPSKKLPSRLNAPVLVRMVQETCVAELTHAMLCVLGFGCVFIGKGAHGWALAFLFAVGNLPYIVIQRYNRPKLLRILEKLEAKPHSLHFGQEVNPMSCSCTRQNHPRWQGMAGCLPYLLYWPVFGVLFFCVERVWMRDSYYPVSCPLDALIPFCEYFIFPYLFWFVFLAGMQVYALFREPDAFKKMMRFIMITYTAAIIIYLVFPNCQQLRPVAFARDNILTRFISAFYQFDTNTNVCPSLRVAGSVAVFLCAWHSKRFSSPGWRVAFTLTTILISVSTVFLKQHSVVDVLAALPLCLVGYWAVYSRQKRKEAQKKRLCAMSSRQGV